MEHIGVCVIKYLQLRYLYFSNAPIGKQTKLHNKRDSIPSQICLNAKAAAAAESSDVPMPLVRIPRTKANIDGSLDAASSHFEYAPIVKHTDNI